MERQSGNETIHVTTWLFAHAHRIKKWRPTERQLLKCLVFYLVISAKSYEDSVISWTCAQRNAADLRWNYGEYLRQCWDSPSEKEERRRWTIWQFDKFQFGTSAMVASDFDGLRGYRTLEYEGQVPTKPYNCCFSRVFQASVCIVTYGMYVPSLHTESADSVIQGLQYLHSFTPCIYRGPKSVLHTLCPL